MKIFESSIMRRMFGPKKDERMLHNEKLESLYCSPNKIRVVKSRSSRRAEHVTKM
jgi:hypothetical protein